MSRRPLANKQKTTHFKLDQMRIGVKAAVLKILERAFNRERFTSIVLPTRYGKSDAIRMSACECIHSGFASVALILSPGLQLAKQMIDEQKLRQMEDRYLPEYAGLIGRVTRVTSLVNPNANGEWILSATIQFVQLNLGIFAEWVRFQKAKTGLPVLVYVDEAHTGSTTNRWGEITKVLAEAGALVILLTATPFREDGKGIHGFKWHTVSEEDYTKYVTRDGQHPDLIKIQVYEGTRRLLRLTPDYEYGLNATNGAWGEDPLPIAKLDFIPFAVELDKYTDGNRTDRALLKDMKPTAVRQILGRIVRDPFVIRAGVKELVAKLTGLRDIDSLIQAIIFCGNDKPDDPDDDRHAKEIYDELKRQAPHFRIGISTTASDEDQDDDQLDALAAGKIDIVIVKQRGGVGLDVPPLKVLLDLSPVRAAASYLQRLMRVATVYKNFVGFVIAPAEPIGQELFNRFIADEGGQATATDLQLMDEYEIPRKDKKVLPYYAVDGIADADFGDSDGRWADAQMRTQVDSFFSYFAGALGHVTHATVAEHIEQGTITIKPRPATAPQMSPDEQKRLLKASINQKHVQAINRYMRMHNIAYDKSAYGAIAPKIWNTAYGIAGLGPFVKLADQNDLKKLEALKRAFDKIVSRFNPEEFEEMIDEFNAGKVYPS